MKSMLVVGSLSAEPSLREISDLWKSILLVTGLGTRKNVDDSLCLQLIISLVGFMPCKVRDSVCAYAYS